MADNNKNPHVEYLEAMGHILAAAAEQNPSLEYTAPGNMLALLLGIYNPRPLHENGGISLPYSATHTRNIGVQQQQQQPTDNAAAGAAVPTLMDSIIWSENNESGNQQVDPQQQFPQLALRLQLADPSNEDQKHPALGIGHWGGLSSFPPTFQAQQAVVPQQTNESAMGVALGHPQPSTFPPQPNNCVIPPEQRGLDTLTTLYGLGNATIPLVDASLHFAYNPTLHALEGPAGCSVEVSPCIANEESTKMRQNKRPKSWDSYNSDDSRFNLNRDQEKKPCAKRRAYSAVSFAEKLFKMITDQEASGKRDVVEFLDGGGGFWLRDPDAIPALMTKYNFRGTKFSGFRRQLNSYGFRVDRNEGPQKGVFKNPLFSRGRPDLCRKIIRDSHARIESKESDECAKMGHKQNRQPSRAD